MSDTFEIGIALVIAHVLCIGTFIYTQSAITTDCDKLGTFYVGEKVYECKRKEQP